MPGLSWAPRATIHIHIHISGDASNPSAAPPQHVRASMLLTGERSATCPDSVSVRRDPCPAAFFLRGIRSTMQVNVDLCDDVMFFVSEMLQNNYSACRTRRWHSGHDSLNLVLNRGTYTAAGFSIKCFPLSHDQPRRAFLLSIMPQVPL